MPVVTPGLLARTSLDARSTECEPITRSRAAPSSRFLRCEGDRFRRHATVDRPLRRRPQARYTRTPGGGVIIAHAARQARGAMHGRRPVRRRAPRRRLGCGFVVRSAAPIGTDFVVTSRDNPQPWRVQPALIPWQMHWSPTRSARAGRQTIEPMPPRAGDTAARGECRSNCRRGGKFRDHRRASRASISAGFSRPARESPVPLCSLRRETEGPLQAPPPPAG